MHTLEGAPESTSTPLALLSAPSSVTDPRPRWQRRRSLAQHGAALENFLLQLATAPTDDDEDAVIDASLLSSAGHFPDASELPRDHPARVLTREATRGTGLMWRTVDATTPADAQPTTEGLEHIERRGLTPDAALLRNVAMQELRGRMARAAERHAETAAQTARWLANYAPALEVPALPVEYLEGLTWPTEDVADDDRPPPPQQLALTTSVLTAAPPATAQPVSGSDRAVS